MRDAGDEAMAATGESDPFVLTGERTRHVTFPMGGIGSGGFVLTGGGRLHGWSIRNRPALHQPNGYTHFAIKAEADGELLGARVLNGPYEGDPSGGVTTRKFFDGYGFGAEHWSLAGVPHFSETTFTGRFPIAEIDFRHAGFPAEIRMTALSPFIPHASDDSSLPAALFSFRLRNTTDRTVTYTLAGTLGNLGVGSGRHLFDASGGLSSLHLTQLEPMGNPSERGCLTIATDARTVEHQAHHYRGQWFDDLGVFWRDFARAGPLPPRHYDGPREAPHMFDQPEHCTLAARLEVPPGEAREVRFVIAWHFPQGDVYWFDRSHPNSDSPHPERPTWTNWYAGRWRDSRDAARDALARWNDIEGRTRAFRDALFSVSAPPEVLDAASAALAPLRTATVIRLEGGELWGWEGQHPAEGSCEGSCTHVWNYQQALPHLFPSLERTLRETEFRYNRQPNGGLTFRQRLPLGSGLDGIGPCADGHFGAVIKTHRDWRICGDADWLRGVWPEVRRTLEYAWSPENPDRWDPGRTGILSGRQHHTLDMELFGPNAWLGSFYFAALAAGAEMAEAVGERGLANEWRAMARAGAAHTDAALFNGEWYVQRIDLADRSIVDAFDTGRAAGVLGDGFVAAYWSEEHGQVKYQLADACLSDQILGVWHADMAGLPPLLDDAHVERALRAVHRHNFRASLDGHFNPCRVYAYEDEGGLLLATWPEGTEKPAVPAPYSEEVWSGIEFASAAHMIARGLLEEGLSIVRASRARHDGRRRSPWNALECGSYYVRSMSAWALVNAWSGLVVDMAAGRLSFAPKSPGPGRHFWSAGTGWGLVHVEAGGLRLEVVGGTVALLEIAVDGAPYRPEHDGPWSAGETVAFLPAGAAGGMG